jgi:hypothetical protein
MYLYHFDIVACERIYLKKQINMELCSRIDYPINSVISLKTTLINNKLDDYVHVPLELVVHFPSGCVAKIIARDRDRDRINTP